MKQIIILALCLMFSVVGCGYKLAGGGYLNTDITRVAVDVFENRSSETSAGVRFTNELVREIQAKTDTVVADGAARTIVGTITGITYATLSRTSTETVDERQVTAVVDVKILDADQKILWSVKAFKATENYETSASTVDDDANKNAAVAAIATRMAERLVSRMTSNF
jgi:outer membrane lipopolysaccharide assembly protein LptE/RlpB